jgi:ketosteroid isomerase-like protein
MAITSHPSPNVTLALRAIKVASDRTLEEFRDVCAPYVTMHMPFHPAGMKTFHGIDQLIRQFRAEETFATFALWAEKVWEVGDTVFVEGRSHGTNSNDLPDYNNHYMFVVRIDNGKIVEWTEFYNPLEAMKQGYGQPREKKAAKA